MGAESVLDTERFGWLFAGARMISPSFAVIVADSRLRRELRLSSDFDFLRFSILSRDLDLDLDFLSRDLALCLSRVLVRPLLDS